MCVEQLELEIPSASEMNTCWFDFPAEPKRIMDEIDDSDVLQRGQDISLGFLRLVKQKELGFTVSKNCQANRSLLYAMQRVLVGETPITQVLQYVYIQGQGWTRAKDIGEHIAFYSLVQLIRSASNTRYTEPRLPYTAFNRVIFRENVLFEAIKEMDTLGPDYAGVEQIVRELKEVVGIYYQKYDRLLYKVIKSNIPQAWEIHDIADELRHVLFNAAYRYAPEVGVGFTYHATLWIKAAIFDLIGKRCRTNEIFCSDSNGDVYEKSLHVVGNEKNTGEDIESSELSTELRLALSEQLSERELDIVSRRFGLNGNAETYVEIAFRYGISSERARQITNSAISKVANSDSSMGLKDYLMQG